MMIDDKDFLAHEPLEDMRTDEPNAVSQPISTSHSTPTSVATAPSKYAATASCSSSSSSEGGSHHFVTEENRKAWNIVTARHRSVEFEKLVAKLRTPDEYCISKREITLLHGGSSTLQGKNIVQIACNNGIELMSLKKLGARYCVGFDISDEAIQYARDLALAAQIDCEFERTNVYEIADTYDATFDIVYVTVGALGWFPDLNTAFLKMANLLKPGGHLCIHEMHPILDMFKPDLESTATKPTQDCHFSDSYFREEAFISEGTIDYINKETYESPAKEHWYHHKLSDIIQAGIASGLVLQLIKEFEEDISMSYGRLSGLPCQLPMSYMVRFFKPQPYTLEKEPIASSGIYQKPTNEK